MNAASEASATPADGQPPLTEFLSRTGAPVVAARPWSRHVLDAAQWELLAGRLASTGWTLAGLWAEPGMVHAALRDEPAGTVAIASLPCPDGRFPSLSGVRPGAVRLERAIRDLHGLEPVGLADVRPWLDHGRWPVVHPLGACAPRSGPPEPYPFLPVEGESLHQVPVGPVHAGIIEPGHFRFTASGETVVRLEQRLGYVHKGTESLMLGAPLGRAARLAGRLSGDSTVAWALAFARAVEAACGVEPPPRAVWLRALMAELERIANHVGDFGAVCNDAAFVLMHAHCGIWRERVLQAADAAFGHRLMMDRVVPGGVAVDPPPAALQGIGRLMQDLSRAFPRLVELYENTSSLQDRTVTTGIAAPGLVRRFAAGGHVGRASGRSYDARRNPGYPPYDSLQFEIPVRSAGDVDARVRIRILEIGQSIGLVEQILDRLPDGPVRADIAPAAGEGMALVESFRGDLLLWLRLGGDGRVERCHPRDPSWFQWPLLEAAIKDNIIADFPICNKSFNCAYSGHDL